MLRVSRGQELCARIWTFRTQKGLRPSSWLRRWVVPYPLLHHECAILGLSRTGLHLDNSDVTSNA